MDETTAADLDPSPKHVSKGTKSSALGKRKLKVDWTPELHKRFVQAVEQLGLEKAVPSRILELMGIDCLTRHNIASHLQKYRSQRRRSLARETEIASSKQRCQIYGAVPGKSNVNPWLTPTMGYPPANFRPFYVWGHPPMDQHSMHMWNPSQPPHVGPYFWHYPNNQYSYSAEPVPGMPPTPLQRVDPGLVVPSYPIPNLKESVDIAIEDVLAKPWLPLPLGLKPPSVDSVLMELQRQGISKIPPTTCI